MAVDKKISQLASGAPAQAGDEYVVARSGANYKLTLTNIAGNMPATTISSGNLNFSGTAQRITGDFNNATIANRLLFQNSVANAATSLGAIPNGASTISGMNLFNNSDPTNAAFAGILIGSTESQFRSAITGTGTYLPMTFYTGGSERMRLDTSGNLGIGATPSYRLDVQGGTASFTGSSGANAIRIAGAGGSWFWIDNPTTTTMRFSSGATAGTGAMVLDSSGNVGIGTTTIGAGGTATRLQVANANTASVGTQANLMVTTTDAQAANVGGIIGLGGSVTTASPTANMRLFGAIRGAKDDATDGGTNGYMAFYTMPASSVTATERMRITSGGEVYIAGTTDQGAYNLQCNGTGVWGAGAYVNGSDARLKDNIQSLDSGLDVVKAMRAVTFQYKPEYSKDQSVQPGFIAQELQTAMAGKPYLEGVVQEGPNHLNVAYQNIIPILVKAIQELEAKVAALEAK